MFAVVWVTLLSLLLCQAFCKRIPSFAGPFIYYVEHNLPCDYGGTDMVLDVRHSQFNPFKPHQKQRLKGNITYRFPLDDTKVIFLKLDVFRNNAWKENALLFKFPRMCTAMRENLPSLFSLLSDGKPTSKGAPCKIEAGVHRVNGLVDWKFPNFPVLPYGRYRLHIQIGPPDRVDAMCGLMIGNVIPRP